MPSVGPGVIEIRAHETGEYRVLYVARFAEGVYMLHAFEKRTRQTRNAGIEFGTRKPGGGAAAPTAIGEAMGAKVRRASGSVFRDLGFAEADAENLRIRSELMARLRKLIEDGGFTQARAARLFGVSQPRVSDLVRGRIELFSIDALVNLLARAGMRVTVKAQARTRAA